MTGVGIPLSKELWSWRDYIPEIEIFGNSKSLAKAIKSVRGVLCTQISSFVFFAGRGM